MASADDIVFRKYDNKKSNQKTILAIFTYRDKCVVIVRLFTTVHFSKIISIQI